MVRSSRLIAWDWSVSIGRARILPRFHLRKKLSKREPDLNLWMNSSVKFSGSSTTTCLFTNLATQRSIWSSTNLLVASRYWSSSTSLYWTISRANNWDGGDSNGSIADDVSGGSNPRVSRFGGQVACKYRSFGKTFFQGREASMSFRHAKVLVSETSYKIHVSHLLQCTCLDQAQKKKTHLAQNKFLKITPYYIA